jgi:hypothetical protein
VFLLNKLLSPQLSSHSHVAAVQSRRSSLALTRYLISLQFQFTAMALSLRAAASLATPPPGRRSASVVRATAFPAALNTRNRRRPQNVSGEFFVGELALPDAISCTCEASPG